MTNPLETNTILVEIERSIDCKEVWIIKQIG